VVTATPFHQITDVAVKLVPVQFRVYGVLITPVLGAIDVSVGAGGGAGGSHKDGG